MNMIAIDLDGTLLTHDLTIHEEDRKAIQQMQKQNYMVAIATGRALFDVQYILEQYHLRCPIISSNGAEIYVDNQKIVEKFMDADLIQAVIPWMNHQEVYYQLYLPGRIIVSDQGVHHLKKQLQEVIYQDARFNVDEFWESAKAPLEQYGLQEVEHITPPAQGEGAIKILVVSPNLSKLEQVKAYLKQQESCEVSSSGRFNLEIMDASVNKGVALQRLCQYCGVDIQNTFAIGDSLNDMHMFQVAGTSIAMENAHEELLKMATFKTLPHDEQGVSYALRNYISKG